MAATLNYIPARHEASTYIMSKGGPPTCYVALGDRHFLSAMTAAHRRCRGNRESFREKIKETITGQAKQ